MIRKFALWLLEIVAPSEQKALANLYVYDRPECNLPYGHCIYRCKLICPRSRS